MCIIYFSSSLFEINFLLKHQFYFIYNIGIGTKVWVNFIPINIIYITIKELRKERTSLKKYSSTEELFQDVEDK